MSWFNCQKEHPIGRSNLAVFDLIGEISHAGAGGRAVVTQYEIGDFVRLRKRHPCGEFDWRVVRVGADIGIVCVGCERRVTMARSALERRMKGQPSREMPQP